MLASLTLALAHTACSGGSGSPVAPAAIATRDAQSTVAAATIVARGPTAIAEATRLALGSGSHAGGGSVVELPPATAAAATQQAATATAAAPTVAARATERASGTAVPSLRLIASRSGDHIEIRLEGPPEAVAAFNFDVVYDQRAITFAAIAAAVDVLDVPGRTFSCNAPPPSVDVDPDPAIGRARVVCFSFGGPDAPAPQAPLTLARITASGQALLSFENVAVFAPDATGIQVEAPPVEVGP